MLILAFDTATSTATSALVRGDEVLGERATTPVRVLEEIDALLRDADVEPRQLDALAVGIGPGSFTGVRMGLAVARGLALSLGVPVAGVSTLAALSAGAPDAVADDDSQQVVEVVRHAAGQLTDRFHFLRLCKLFARPIEHFLCLVTLGNVARHLGKADELASVILDRIDHHAGPKSASILAEPPALSLEPPLLFGPAERIEPVYVRQPDANRMPA